MAANTHRIQQYIHKHRQSTPDESVPRVMSPTVRARDERLRAWSVERLVSSSGLPRIVPTKTDSIVQSWPMTPHLLVCCSELGWPCCRFQNTCPPCHSSAHQLPVSRFVHPATLTFFLFLSSRYNHIVRHDASWVLCTVFIFTDHPLPPSIENHHKRLQHLGVEPTTSGLWVQSWYCCTTGAAH